MRAVGGATSLGTLLGADASAADAPGGAASGTAAGGDAAAAPFAAMLATRLAPVRSGIGTRPSTGDRAPEHESHAEAGSTDAEHSAAGASQSVPDLLAALTSALVPAAATPGASATTTTGASATAAARAPMSASVTHVSRDPSSLVPALRDRVARVVDRMQREYGDTVQIAEAGRTQARQNYLFSQGRTRSGPVVTWTRDSAHTRGRAVDVTINGGYDDAAAFARLQQVAQSEGLRTLGARDPGHLELPRGVPGEVPALAAPDDGGVRITVESLGVRTELGAPTSGASGFAMPSPNVAPAVTVPGGVATVAAVAPVAQVAPVASIAPVASAAMPGAIAHPVAAGHPAAHPAAQSTVHLTSQAAAHPATSGAPRVTAHDTPRTDGPHAAGRRASSPPTRGTTVTSRPLPGADIARGAGARSRGRGEDHMDDHDREQPPRGDTRAHDSAAPTDVAGTDASPTPVAAPTTTATTAGATGAPALVAPAPDASAGTAASTDAPPTLGAIAAERIARVLDAQQAAAPRTVSHLTVRVDRADGGEDRIHLDLRGQAVDARIDVADLSTADSLTARTPELRAALAQHGLTTDDVRVRAAPGDPRGGSDAVSALDDAGATSVASFGRAPQTDSGTGDQARDPSRDQPARDPDARGEQRSDGRSSDRHAQDDGSSGRRTSDQHQGRRRPSDDVFPATAPRGAGRTTA